MAPGRARHGDFAHTTGTLLGAYLGAEGRLDFTVIGPAVNTASRLEGVCGKLSRRVIVSADFAACVAQTLVSLGEIELKGVSVAQAVFGVDE